LQDVEEKGEHGLPSTPLELGDVTFAQDFGVLRSHSARADRQCDRQARRHGRRHAAPPHELAQAIGPAALPGADGQVPLETPHVVSKSAGRCVPALGRAAQRLHDDGVEIASETPGQLTRTETACPCHLGSGRRAGTVYRGTGHRKIVHRRTGHRHGGGGARSGRVALGEDALDLAGCGAGEIKWQTAGKQLVEQHAEAVNVAGRSHQLAAQ
jgi:hypothetical protein